jgi:hypothetical protein
MHLSGTGSLQERHASVDLGYGPACRALTRHGQREALHLTRQMRSAQESAQRIPLGDKNGSAIQKSGLRGEVENGDRLGDIRR